MENDRAILISVIQAFLTEAPSLLQQFDDAVATGNQEVALRSAHTLKSNFGILQQQAEREIWQRLETLVKNNKFDELPEPAAQAHEMSQRAFEQLTAFLEGAG